jgi:hypothetical protein
MDDDHVRADVSAGAQYDECNHPPLDVEIPNAATDGEWIAKRFLDMDDTIRFTITTPSEQDAILIPARQYFIESSEAIWEDQNLGTPVHLDKNPTIGGVPLPTRPILVIGEAHARTRILRNTAERGNRYRQRNDI